MGKSKRWIPTPVRAEQPDSVSPTIFKLKEFSMNEKLDRIGNLGILTIIGMIFISLLCSCNPFTGPRHVPPRIGESATDYAGRLEGAAQLIDSDPANIWNIIESAAAAAGLTGLSLWIRKVKQNGYTQSTDLERRFQAAETDFAVRLGNLESRFSQANTPEKSKKNTK
jgi:hypothetical protein